MRFPGDSRRWEAIVCGCLMLAACDNTTGPESVREFAYVTNSASNTVSVIDIGAHSVVATVAVGDQPIAVTITPDGRLVYVGNRLSEDVTVIETAGNTVVATIPTGQASLGIAAHPDGEVVYQALRGEANAVAVISTTENAVISTVPVGERPEYVAFKPNDSRAYVANIRSHDVSIIETETHSVVGTIDLTGVIENPYGLAFTQDGSVLYVGSYSRNGRIAVLRTSDNAVSDTIGGAPNALELAVTDQGRRAYVALYQLRIAVFDLEEKSLVETIDADARSFAQSGDGAFLYATLYPDSSVAVIDIRSNAIVETIPVGVKPFDIAIATLP